MHARRQVTTVKTGAPVPTGTTVEMRLHLDNSLVATTETNAEGWFEFLRVGNPGPHYFVVAVENEVHISSSRGTGIAGVVDITNLPLFIRSFQSGYVSGVLNELAVTAAGTSMQVVVGAGAGYYRGILYDQHISQSVSIDAPNEQARIDLLVVEVVPQGGGDTTEGRSRLRLKKGTPSTSPTAPGLTQTATLWEEPLAEIRVDPGVSAIASNKVTDRRTRMGPILAPKSITWEMLADNATPGVRVHEEGVLKALHARMLDFGGNDFIIQEVSSDYTQDTRPGVTVHLDRPKILAWLAAELDLDTGAPPTNPTYTVRSADKNFDASGVWSGGWAAIPGASVQLVLPAGAWLIEAILNMSIRGTGNGAQCTVRLVGNGTPQGENQSMRIFRADSATRQIILSGRRNVSHSGNATYTATVERTHQSGPYVDFRDGVIYVKAMRV